MRWMAYDPLDKPSTPWCVAELGVTRLSAAWCRQRSINVAAPVPVPRLPLHFIARPVPVLPVPRRLTIILFRFPEILLIQDDADNGDIGSGNPLERPLREWDRGVIGLDDEYHAGRLSADDQRIGNQLHRRAID